MLAQDTHAPKTVHGAQWEKKGQQHQFGRTGFHVFFFCFGTCAIIKHKGKLIPQEKQLPVKIDNLQVTSRDSIELRRGRILRTCVRTLPSTWRTVSAPRLGSACSHHRMYGCHDGTFNWKPSWIGKGQTHRYRMSVGTRCHFDWKCKVVQEEHSRNARGLVYQTLRFRPNENALRQTELPL